MKITIIKDNDIVYYNIEYLDRNDIKRVINKKIDDDSLNFEFIGNLLTQIELWK